MTRYVFGTMRNGKVINEHVLVAEAALGRQLRGTEQVHHFNEIKSDNRNGNLVICPNSAYHELLHIRTRALDACGNPNYRKCTYCKEWDDPAVMANNAKKNPNGRFVHRRCHSEYTRSRSSPSTSFWKAK